ncbi:lipid-binding SYLF domain-containing protein [Massilia sp. LXY-6]|uniref:lipid-binding SYLF domain-containing protein n=1 Tax=Massilia sp. LXY-6 TaxID=3379823 RepID=UPI003EDE8E6E
MPSNKVFRRTACPAAAALLLLCALPVATAPAAAVQDRPASQGATGNSGSKDNPTRRQQAAFTRVSDAVGVVNAMAKETGMQDLLAKARGVYLVPTYGRAALGVGGEGGSGVLMVRRADDSWGNPAFFNIGGISVGLQAGVEGGPFALLLMNQKAVDHFRNRNNFSLSADAGLTVVNFSRLAAGMATGDVVAWSGSKGLFGNAATLAINDIRFNQRLNDAYYGKTMSALQTIDSTEKNTQADALRTVLGK